MIYEDKILVCKDCDKEFTFPASDQEFYASKEFVEPKRCKPCRQIKKQRREEHE